jgi:cold shock CspA family protein
MIGTVTHIPGDKASFCIITRPEAPKEVFAHRRDFLNPADMQRGKIVQFRLKLAKTGKRPEATDVEAA